MVTDFWVSIGIVASVAAIMVWAFGLPSPINLSRGKLSWKRAKGGILNIRDQLQAGKWSPNLVIGVGKSGTVVAAVLLDNLGWPEYGYKFVAWNVKKMPPITFPTLEQETIFGKKCLLVDSEVYTGETMRQALDYIRRYGASEIKTVALVYNPLSIIRPDYYAITVSEVTPMPWEYWSTKYRQEHRKMFWPRQKT